MVVIKYCDQYDLELVKQKIKESIEFFDLLDSINEKTRVFIKLNCVSPFPPEMGITTHPIVLKSVIQLLKTKTKNIVVGDNPAIREIIFTLKKCGLYQVIMDEGVRIFKPDDFITIHNSNPILYSDFEVSKEMIDTDVIINLPKIKTHSLAYMTCAQKNFFGLIYGLNKSAWHVRAQNPLEFGEALNDLYGALIETFKGRIIHIADGIIGLEGEGPSSGGIPKEANVLLTSDDAISLDRIALSIAHLDYNKLFINKIANERGYGIGDLDKIELKGDPLSLFDDVKFLAPKDSISLASLKFLKTKALKGILLEHPVIDTSKCIKCGQCTKICPPKAMTIAIATKEKEYPHLNKKVCIRCWCCAEVCPQNAIYKSKRPLIGRIILKTDRKTR